MFTDMVTPQSFLVHAVTAFYRIELRACIAWASSSSVYNIEKVARELRSSRISRLNWFEFEISRLLEGSNIVTVSNLKFNDMFTDMVTPQSFLVHAVTSFYRTWAQDMHCLSILE